MKYSWSLTSAVVFRPDPFNCGYRANIGLRGSPSSRNFFFRTGGGGEGQRQQTQCIAMTKKYVRKIVVIFGSIPKSNFWRFLGHRTYCNHARCPSVLRRLLDNLHFQLLLQNRLIDFDETWYGWSTQGPLQVLLYFGQIRPGAGPSGAKICVGPFFKELLL